MTDAPNSKNLGPDSPIPGLADSGAPITAKAAAAKPASTSKATSPTQGQGLLDASEAIADLLTGTRAPIAPKAAAAKQATPTITAKTATQIVAERIEALLPPGTPQKKSSVIDDGKGNYVITLAYPTISKVDEACDFISKLGLPAETASAIKPHKEYNKWVVDLKVARDALRRYGYEDPTIHKLFSNNNEDLTDAFNGYNFHNLYPGMENSHAKIQDIEGKKFLVITNIARGTNPNVSLFNDMDRFEYIVEKGGESPKPKMVDGKPVKKMGKDNQPLFVTQESGPVVITVAKGEINKLFEIVEPEASAAEQTNNTPPATEKAAGAPAVRGITPATKPPAKPAAAPVPRANSDFTPLNFKPWINKVFDQKASEITQGSNKSFSMLVALPLDDVRKKLQGIGLNPDECDLASLSSKKDEPQISVTISESSAKAAYSSAQPNKSSLSESQRQ